MTGIILSGGKNLRMGTNKAFLEIGGRTIIERTIALFKEIFDEVILVTNEPLEYLALHVRMVSDVFVSKGALGGVYTGLLHASNPHAFFSACDMPFLNKAVIQYMISVTDAYDVVVPQIGPLLEPLHAIYSRRCIRQLERQIKQQRLKLIDLLSKVRVRRVTEEELKVYDAELRCFLNINTPEEYRKLQEISASLPSPHPLPKE